MSSQSSPSLEVSEDRSCLPWLDGVDTAPLRYLPTGCADSSANSTLTDAPPWCSAYSIPCLAASARPAIPSEALVITAASSLPSGRESPATSLSPNSIVTVPKAVGAGDHSAPSARPFLEPPSRNVEAELRATVDALLKRKKDTQRGLAEENANLREEVAFLRNALRLSSAKGQSECDADAHRAELANALEQERAQRLRSEEKLNALVEYLAEQIASVSERANTAEKALKTIEHDCVRWKDKAAAVMGRCEVLEEENLRVKSILHLIARYMPAAVQQQTQNMLNEVAQERADLRRLEEIERSLDKLGNVHSQTQASKTMSRNVSREEHLGNYTTTERHLQLSILLVR
ncbi:hypothetical protein BD414DRAFT_407408 [Trametes punicea]|nr:hypothetical protein BD414DRAFT_407408 [Trametes punicea]